MESNCVPSLGASFIAESVRSPQSTMVVPPATGGIPLTNNTTQATPSTSSFQVNLTNSSNNGMFPVYSPHIPISARRAPPLDVSSVERKGHHLAVRESNKRLRPHGLQDAPTFRPTEEEFRDPMEYMRKIAPEGRKYGICKIIPPEGWNPEFAIDTEVSGAISLGVNGSKDVRRI